MRSRWYIVIAKKDQWWIDCDGKPYGPFPTQQAAVAAAPKFIAVTGDPDLRNEVYVRQPSGRYAVVWSNQTREDDANSRPEEQA